MRLILILALTTPLFAQQSPVPQQAPAPIERVSPDAPDAVAEIHVDQNGRVFLQDRPNASGHPRMRADPLICQLHNNRAKLTQNLYTESVVNGVVQRATYEVLERNFTLFNITPITAAFIVQVPVPKGWSVDSVPKPNSIDNNVATFRVYAKPAESIRLHVGIRHYTHGKYVRPNPSPQVSPDVPPSIVGHGSPEPIGDSAHPPF